MLEKKPSIFMFKMHEHVEKFSLEQKYLMFISTYKIQNSTKKLKFWNSIANKYHRNKQQKQKSRGAAYWLRHQSMTVNSWKIIIKQNGGITIK